MTLHARLTDAGVDVRPATADHAVDGQMPGLVARPADTAQVSAALVAASQTATSVAATAGRTKTTWGAPAPAPGLLLDLSGLDRLVEHQPGDLIATAEAGCRLSTIQDAVAGAGQRLGVDEMVPGTTIGGLIATNPSGPRRMVLGTVRDLVIGVTVVRADGVVARAGGKVVKNVAGYDLSKLMVGSYGTLAVVTEATFRLHPVPATSTWVRREVDLTDVAKTVAAVLHSQVVPAALEVDSPVDGRVGVAVLLEGTQGGVAGRADETARLLGDGAEAGPPPDTGYPWGAGQLGLKVTCRLSAVPDVLRLCRELGMSVRGSAGTGVLYAAAPAGATVADVAATLGRLRSLARDSGGAVIVLDGPRDARAELDVWGPVASLHLMQRVKDQMDPQHLLNPTRFVGGI